MGNALVIHQESGTDFQAYLARLKEIPMLTAEEEYDLAVRFHDHQDLDAAHRLVTSYLHYVVKISREYQGYGLKLMDLIQEGSVGLMQAVKKFDPYKGFRLATYAGWWIRAAIQEFVLKSWSLVKIATTSEQRKLFFNLRKSKTSIDRLNQAQAEELGNRLGVRTKTVLEMDQRLSSPDDTLNRPAVESGEEIQNFLAHPQEDQESVLLDSESKRVRQEAVQRALSDLSEREREIVHRRFLNESAETLQTIGESLGISRERVRQLEKRALTKMKGSLSLASL
ncbi:MAG: RNA polymerase sigma factor RpoH [Magnetococcales bacterium]|nr:RNA polymerase sigma factor RpoH [Magnetococcales bacterium]